LWQQHACYDVQQQQQEVQQQQQQQQQQQELHPQQAWASGGYRDTLDPAIDGLRKSSGTICPVAAAVAVAAAATTAAGEPAGNDCTDDQISDLEPFQAAADEDITELRASSNHLNNSQQEGYLKQLALAAAASLTGQSVHVQGQCTGHVAVEADGAAGSMTATRTLAGQAQPGAGAVSLQGTVLAARAPTALNQAGPQNDQQIASCAQMDERHMPLDSAYAAAALLLHMAHAQPESTGPVAEAAGDRQPLQ
jgi:hypothetical protein